MRVPASSPVTAHPVTALRVTALLVTGLCLLPVACAPTPAEPVTLTWWDSLDHSPVADQAVDALIARYREQHPEVAIERTSLPRAELEARLEAADPAPDIAVVDVAALPRLASRDALADLTTRFEAWDLHERFFEPVRDSVRFEGRYHGVPLLSTTTALLYNRDLFAAVGVPGPPRTWDELRTTAEALTRDGASGLCLAGEDPATAFLPFLWQAGGDVRQIGAGASVRALSYVDSLVGSPGAAGVLDPDAVAAFSAGRCAMLVHGPDAVHRLNRAGLDWGSAPLPSGPAGAVSGSGGSAWVVGRTSGHPDRAWDVLRWLAEHHDNATEFGAALNAVPNRSDTHEHPGWQWDPNLPAFTAQLRSTRSPYTPRHPEVSAVLSAMTRAVLVDGRPPAEAAAEAAAALEPLLR